MRHKSKGRKLKRVRKQRKALLKGLAFNFIKHGKIKTTEAKAKELRPFVEKIISKAKVDNLSNRRIIIARLGENSVKKLFSEIGPRYKERKGGYTRITKLPPRKGDASKMAIIEFVL
ncbi:50S ribosomal protein L17 [Patescibacteria group bacterium]|nr:50S ribosomal protein L17 [Patescibacteria group bacterium]